VSCLKCEDNPEGSQLRTYVRIGNANVEISGCNSHLAELLRLLKIGMRKDAEDNER